MDDFYVTLPSNVSSVFFENTSTNFRTKLAKRINVTEDYEVGLAEISYTLRFYNIMEDEKIKIKIKNQEKYITLKSGYYKITELIETINNSFKLIEEVKIHPRFELLKDDKIRINFGVYQSRYFSVEMSDNLCHMLGFDKKSMDINSEIIRIRIQKDLPISKIFEIIRGFKGYFDGIKPYDIKAGVHLLFIYCDIIKPHFVGDSNLQLLKYVEIPNNLEYGDQVHLKYSNIQYFNIQTKEFDSVEISITDDTGKKVHFSNAKNVVVLHFRKKIIKV